MGLQKSAASYQAILKVIVLIGCFILVAANLPVAKCEGQEEPLRILMILKLTSGTYSHFEVHKKIAEVMVNDKNVEKMLILGLTEEPGENADIDHPHPKLTIWKRYRCGTARPEECSTHFPQISKKESQSGNLWRERPDFLPKPEKGPKRTYIEFILHNQALLAQLGTFNFNVGSIEINTEIDALPLTIFRLLPSIHTTMITSAPPPSISHWVLLGYPHFAEAIPGLSLGAVGDHEKVMRGEKVFKAKNDLWINGKIKIAEMTLNQMRKEFSEHSNLYVNNIKLSDIANSLESMSVEFKKAALFLTNIQLPLEFPIVEQTVMKNEKNNISNGGPKLGLIGGIGMSTGQALDLDQETMQIFDGNDKKVMLVSFGSIVQFGVPKASAVTNQIEAGIVQRFLHVFEQFPALQFIMKYGPKEQRHFRPPVAGLKAGNVHGKGWLEQEAILAQNQRNNNHKLAAFISHCGLNSVMESVKYGIPQICLPLYADQVEIAEAIASRGLAKVVDIHKKNWPDVLKKAIEEMLADDSYRRNTAIAMEQFNSTDPAKVIKEGIAILRKAVNQHKQQENILKSESSVNEGIAISLGVKRYDGGSIKIHEVGGEERNENIETLLNALYGINVEYLTFEQKELERVWHGRILTGHVRFLSEHFGWKAGYVEQIWRVLQEISKFDSRWVMPGQTVKDNHNEEQFVPRFDGHTVVILNRHMNGGRPKELARFHLTRYGFQIFKKEEINGQIVGRSYFIEENAQNPQQLGEREETEIVPDKRGQHFKVAFAPSLWVNRQFVGDGAKDIEALKQIAWRKVIAGKKFSFETFTCMHFVFKFVLTIAQNPSTQLRTSLEAWPKEMQEISEFQRANRGVLNPFYDIVNEMKEEEHQEGRKNEQEPSKKQDTGSKEKRVVDQSSRMRRSRL